MITVVYGSYSNKELGEEASFTATASVHSATETVTTSAGRLQRVEPQVKLRPFSEQLQQNKNRKSKDSQD